MKKRKIERVASCAPLARLVALAVWLAAITAPPIHAQDLDLRIVGHGCPMPGSGWASAITVRDQVAYLGTGRGFVAIDVSETHKPQLLGGYDAGSPARAIAVEEGKVYLSCMGPAGFQIVDVTNPQGPVLLGAVAVLSADGGMAVDFPYAYIGASYPVDENSTRQGLVVVDISNPNQPEIKASVADEGVQDIVVRGDRAFVANTFDGLVVYDISDPEAPLRVATQPATGQSRSLTVQGDYAYLTTKGWNVEGFDISDPLHPVPVSALPVEGGIQSSLSGQHLFVVGGISFQVLDVQDPGQPVEVGSPTEPFGHAVDVVSADGYCFVVDELRGLQIIDVRTPSAPTLVSHLGVFDSIYGFPEPYGPSADFVALREDLAFVPMGHSGLHVYTIADPDNPSWRAAGLRDRDVQFVAMNGDTAYVRSGPTLLVVDVTDLDAMFVERTIDLVGDAGTLAHAGRWLLVADGLAGVTVFDTVNPHEPIQVGHYAPSGTALSVVARGADIYVLIQQPDETRAVELLSLAEDGQLNRLQTMALSEAPNELGFRNESTMGGGAYSAGSRNLAVYSDMAHARGPVLAVYDPMANFFPAKVLGQVPLPNFGVPFWRDDHVWIAGDGITSVAVALANPQSISRIAEPDWHLGAVVALESREDLVIAEDDEDYRVVSVSDPLHPEHLEELVVRRIGTDTFEITNPGDPAHTRNTGVFRVGRRGRSSEKAEVGEWTLQVEPEELIATNSSGITHSVFRGNPGEEYFLGLIVEGDVGFLTGRNLIALDFSDPLSPAELDRVEESFGLWLDGPAIRQGEVLYVLDGPDGFHLFDVADPANMIRMGGNSGFTDFADLAVCGDYLVAAAGYEGLIILNKFKELRFGPASVEADGQIRLPIDGACGQRVKLQRSDNLVDWEDWQTMTLGGTATGCGLVDSTTATPHRFYRVVRDDPGPTDTP